MTPWQVTAIANPCLLAEETVHPRFAHSVKGRVGLVLTVNAGYE
jgi:hypothetical protein